MLKGREGFCKIRHIFLTVLRNKVKYKHQKALLSKISLSNTDNFSKYCNSDIQFHAKENPQWIKHFY